MVGGNITGVIEKKTTVSNGIGENVPGWTEEVALRGWLDLCSGESKYIMYNSKVQESTHVFMCVTTRNSMLNRMRMVIKGKSMMCL